MVRAEILFVGIAMAAATPLLAQEAAHGERPRVEVGGMLLVNGFYNDAFHPPFDLPLVAPPPSVPPLEGTTTGSRIHQSRIIVRVRSDRVLGGSLTSEFDMDFYGRSPRLRRAVATVHWPHAWVVFGQEALPISPLDPSSFATVAVPGFTGAGNLSRWLPQVRAGAATGGRLRIGIEGTLVTPVTGFSLSPEEIHRPMLEARALAHWGRDPMEGTLGVAVHHGWMRGFADTLLTAQAVGFATRFWITRYVEIRAEAFLGEAADLLASQDLVEQSIGENETPVDSKGGWVQLLVHLNAEWELGGGYGMDDADDDDVQAAAVYPRLKNTAWEIHAHWRPGPLVLAAEYRRIETTYLTGALSALQPLNHVNVAMGVVF